MAGGGNEEVTELCFVVARLWRGANVVDACKDDLRDVTRQT